MVVLKILFLYFFIVAYWKFVVCQNLENDYYYSMEQTSDEPTGSHKNTTKRSADNIEMTYVRTKNLSGNVKLTTLQVLNSNNTPFDKKHNNLETTLLDKNKLYHNEVVNEELPKRRLLSEVEATTKAARTDVTETESASLINVFSVPITSGNLPDSNTEKIVIVTPWKIIETASGEGFDPTEEIEIVTSVPEETDDFEAIFSAAENDNSTPYFEEITATDDFSEIFSSPQVTITTENLNSDILQQNINRKEDSYLSSEENERAEKGETYTNHVTTAELFTQFKELEKANEDNDKQSQFEDNEFLLSSNKLLATSSRETTTFSSQETVSTTLKEESETISQMLENTSQENVNLLPIEAITSRETTTFSSQEIETEETVSTTFKEESTTISQMLENSSQEDVSLLLRGATTSSETTTFSSQEIETEETVSTTLKEESTTISLMLENSSQEDVSLLPRGATTSSETTTFSSQEIETKETVSTTLKEESTTISQMLENSSQEDVSLLPRGATTSSETTTFSSQEIETEETVSTTLKEESTTISLMLEANSQEAVSLLPIEATTSRETTTFASQQIETKETVSTTLKEESATISQMLENTSQEDVSLLPREATTFSPSKIQAEQNNLWEEIVSTTLKEESTTISQEPTEILEDTRPESEDSLVTEEFSTLTTLQVSGVMVSLAETEETPNSKYFAPLDVLFTAAFEETSTEETIQPTSEDSFLLTSTSDSILFTSAFETTTQQKVVMINEDQSTLTSSKVKDLPLTTIEENMSTTLKENEDISTVYYEPETEENRLLSTMADETTSTGQKEETITEYFQMVTVSDQSTIEENVPSTTTTATTSIEQKVEENLLQSTTTQETTSTELKEVEEDGDRSDLQFDSKTTSKHHEDIFTGTTIGQQVTTDQLSEEMLNDEEFATEISVVELIDGETIETKLSGTTPFVQHSTLLRSLNLILAHSTEKPEDIIEDLTSFMEVDEDFLNSATENVKEIEENVLDESEYVNKEDDVLQNISHDGEKVVTSSNLEMNFDLKESSQFSESETTTTYKNEEDYQNIFTLSTEIAVSAAEITSISSPINTRIPSTVQEETLTTETAPVNTKTISTVQDEREIVTKEEIHYSTTHATSTSESQTVIFIEDKDIELTTINADKNTVLSTISENLINESEIPASSTAAVMSSFDKIIKIEFDTEADNGEISEASEFKFSATSEEAVSEELEEAGIMQDPEISLQRSGKPIKFSVKISGNESSFFIPPDAYVFAHSGDNMNISWKSSAGNMNNSLWLSLKKFRRSSQLNLVKGNQMHVHKTLQTENKSRNGDTNVITLDDGFQVSFSNLDFLYMDDANKKAIELEAQPSAPNPSRTLTAEILGGCVGLLVIIGILIYYIVKKIRGKTRNFKPNDVA